MKKALSGRRSTLWRMVLRGSWETPHNRCNKGTFDKKLLSSSPVKISGRTKSVPDFYFLPQTLLCSRLPLQGDGVGDGVCDGELSHFKCRRQDRTLWGKSQFFFLKTAATVVVKGLWFSQCSFSLSSFFLSGDWERRMRKCDGPAEHIPWPQPRQHLAWCSAPSRRICWFSLWRQGSWKRRPQSPQHVCLPFSALWRESRDLFIHYKQIKLHCCMIFGILRRHKVY